MRRLIVNADDFGLTEGVNRSIAELHAQGVLTSATLMARASATQQAIRQALTIPKLGVGCHLVLVDGEPALDPREIPSLVDPVTRQFHSTLARSVARALTGRIRAVEVEAEASAQIRSLQACGLRLTHIDTHKHTHMFPSVLRPLLRAARAAGIHAVRNPFEPPWSRRATPNAPWTRRFEVMMLHNLKSAFQRIVKEEGMRTTDGSIGVLATGSLDIATLTPLLAAIPQGTWELVTHPGYNDADLAQVRTRLTASREIELRALPKIAEKTGWKLISFAELGEDSLHDN